MLSAAEYLLKAENYAVAAQTAQSLDQKTACIHAAAICRNKALRIVLGNRADVLRRCPFSRDELMPF